jgi:hypothetical protein
VILDLVQSEDLGKIEEVTRSVNTKDLLVIRELGTISRANSVGIRSQ